MSESTARERYRDAKATKLIGMGGGKSELSILLMNAGNRTVRDSPEGRDSHIHGTFGGKDERNSEFEYHLNETAKDSNVGQG